MKIWIVGVAFVGILWGSSPGLAGRSRLQKTNPPLMRLRVVLDEHSKIAVVRAAAEVL